MDVHLVIDRLHPGIGFYEWLLRNYGEDTERLHDKVLRVGSENDYSKVMNWYRKRYEKEKRQYDAVQQLTIFDFMEVNKHGI
ncbi:MAG: hypothetical protein IJU80_06620 [Lachnospiraceae bacterium]|nr:hypothetical protein [Lachnospiraceae bacterium]